MEHQPGDRRQHTPPRGMYGLDRPVLVDVHAIEAERDDEGEDSSETVQVQTALGGRADEDGVGEFS